jgi:hypothetical protein
MNIASRASARSWPGRAAAGTALSQGLAVLLLLAAGSAGCATGSAIGRGGPVYEVRVATIDGNPTSNRGSSAHPACTLQVADRVAPVWLALPSHADRESPVILEADAEALKDGILVERSWNEAVVHQVTEAELAAGAAVVYVPGRARPTTVELRFEPISRLSRSDRKNDLAKRRAGFEQPVGGGDLR